MIESTVTDMSNIRLTAAYVNSDGSRPHTALASLFRLAYDPLVSDEKSVVELFTRIERGGMTGDVADRFDCDLARDLSSFMSTHPVGNDQDQRTIL
jgi:hypothetical protein